MLDFQIVSLILLVVTVAGMGVVIFILWRQFLSPYAPLPWPYLRWRFRQRFYQAGHPLFDIIRRAEAKAGVKLTWGARELLTIPVLEIIQRGGHIDWAEVEQSVRDLLDTMKESPPEKELPREVRSSRSVIGAFFKRFCNIPPFCSGREEG